MLARLMQIPQSAPIIKNLILDWDGTLTRRDTLSVIASIAYDKRKEGLVNGSIPPWSYFVGAYYADYIAHKDAYRPPPSERKSLVEEISWLQSLTAVERASVERTERLGLWKGVTHSDIRDAARRVIECKEVEMRPGWDRFVGEIQHAGGKVAIGSVNWSGTFINQALRMYTDLHPENSPAVDVDKIEIYANDIEMCKEGSASGKMTRWFEKESTGIWTASDKARIVNEMRHGRSDRGTVYIGDSVSDLQCLLQADIGICIRDPEMESAQRGLADTLERLSIRCLPIQEWKLHTYFEEEKEKKLWWTLDFDAVKEALC